MSVDSSISLLADIVKMIDSQPDLAPLIRRVRGGYLKIQGTWMPYEVSRLPGLYTHMTKRFTDALFFFIRLLSNYHEGGFIFFYQMFKPLLSSLSSILEWHG